LWWAESKHSRERFFSVKGRTQKEAVPLCPITKYKKELKEAYLLMEIKEGQGKVSRYYLAKP